MIKKASLFWKECSVFSFGTYNMYINRHKQSLYNVHEYEIVNPKFTFKHSAIYKVIHILHTHADAI